MPAMDAVTYSNFITSLAEYMQFLCHRYLVFNEQVLLSGQLCLSIDIEEQNEFVVNEKLKVSDQKRIVHLSNSCYIRPQEKSDTSVNSSPEKKDLLGKKHQKRGRPKKVKEFVREETSTRKSNKKKGRKNGNSLLEDSIQSESCVKPDVTNDLKTETIKLKTEEIIHFKAEGGHLKNEADDVGSFDGDTDVQELDSPEVSGDESKAEMDESLDFTGEQDSNSLAEDDDDLKESRPEPVTCWDPVRKITVYKCSYCGKGFPARSITRKHERYVHENEKNYCSFCGKTFKTRHTAKKHERFIHLKERNFSCNICGKSFITNFRLKVHQEGHAGIKSHTCEICGKAFHLSGNLKVHMFTHTGEKPYTCDICGRAFSQSQHLKRHKNGHVRGTIKTPVKAESDSLPFQPSISDVSSFQYNLGLSSEPQNTYTLPVTPVQSSLPQYPLTNDSVIYPLPSTSPVSSPSLPYQLPHQSYSVFSLHNSPPLPPPPQDFNLSSSSSYNLPQ